MLNGEYHQEEEFDNISREHNKNKTGFEIDDIEAFHNYSYPLNKHLLSEAGVFRMGTGSNPVNEYPEDDEDDDTPFHLHPNYFKNDTHIKVNRLDKLIERNKLTKNLKTYSGIKFTPDKKMILPAFTSTSMDKSVAAQFCYGHPENQNHILEIHHKAGSSAFFMPQKSEKEVLMPRNQKILIHKTEEVSPGNFVHIAERIDDAPNHLQEDLTDFPDSVTQGSFYHGGADVDKLHPLSFFSPNKENADSYARVYGKGAKIHEIQIQNLNKAARDQDVINAAKELGHYEDEYTPANHYLSNSVVEDDVVHSMIDHLKSKGFDHARLHDNDYDSREFTSVLPFHPENQIVR